MIYEIKSGCAIHPVIRGHRKCKYPWAAMNVGDCFDVPTKAGKRSNIESSTLVRMAKLWANRNGLPWGFTTRTVAGGNFIRIWRTA